MPIAVEYSWLAKFAVTFRRNGETLEDVPAVELATSALSCATDLKSGWRRAPQLKHRSCSDADPGDASRWNFAIRWWSDFRLRPRIEKE